MSVNIQIFDVTAIAIALMVFAIACVFMISQVLRRPEWEAYARLELYQVFVSVLIIVFVAIIADFAYTFSYTLAGGDPFTIAHTYLNNLLFEKSFPSIIKLRWLSMTCQYWGGLYTKYGSSNWGIQFPMFPGLNAIESSIEFLINILSPFTASLMVQQIGLEIIQGLMFPVVMPIGVFLRIFPQTREAGVFLIATALGFAIIFPLTYVMHSVVIAEIERANPATWYSELALDPALTEGTGSVGGTATYFNPYYMVAVPLFVRLQELSFVIMQGVFLPALSMILTTSFIKLTSKFISQKFD